MPRRFYGYTILGAAFPIMAVIQGLYMSFGVFFTPIIADTGWTRAELGGAYSEGMLVLGAVSILVGALNDRLGPRIVLSAGVILFAVGHFLMSQVSSVWQVFLVFAVIGMGQSTTEVVVLSTIARWFFRKRSIMSGLVKTGTGLGITVVPIYLTFMISHYDWRITYVVSSIIVMAVGLPLTQLLRKSPVDKNQYPDGDNTQPSGEPKSGESGLTAREALRTRRLWLFCLAWGMGNYGIQTVTVHIAPHAVDIGLSEASAGLVISILGAVSIGGRLFCGWLGDRIGSLKVSRICLLIMALDTLWLITMRSGWALYPFGAFWGFCQGGLIISLSPTSAQLFGTKAHGVLYGILQTIGTVGGAAGPVIAGRIFDMTGTYQYGFILMLAVVVIGLALSMMAHPAKGGTLGSERSVELGQSAG